MATLERVHFFLLAVRCLWFDEKSFSSLLKATNWQRRRRGVDQASTNIWKRGRALVRTLILFIFSRVDDVFIIFCFSFSFGRDGVVVPKSNARTAVPAAAASPRKSLKFLSKYAKRIPMFSVWHLATEEWKQTDLMRCKFIPVLVPLLIWHAIRLHFHKFIPLFIRTVLPCLLIRNLKKKRISAILIDWNFVKNLKTPIEFSVSSTVKHLCHRDPRLLSEQKCARCIFSCFFFVI